MINYLKLDPSLIQAWDDVTNSDKKILNVFIQFDRNLHDDELALLQDKGVNIADSKKKIVTAVLSKNDIESFSEKPWIKQLTLSSKLNLLD